jgi:Holliday junction resolvase
LFKTIVSVVVIANDFVTPTKTIKLVLFRSSIGANVAVGEKFLGEQASSFVESKLLEIESKDDGIDEKLLSERVVSFFCVLVLFWW